MKDDHESVDPKLKFASGGTGSGFRLRLRCGTRESKVGDLGRGLSQPTWSRADQLCTTGHVSGQYPPDRILPTGQRLDHSTRLDSVPISLSGGF